MLCSRKIVSAKVLKGERTENGSKLYLKSALKKSYGKITGKYVILLFPEKSNCKCPVGGICSHTLTSLLFLKYFNGTGKKLLELTPTKHSFKNNTEQQKKVLCQ